VTARSPGTCFIVAIAGLGLAVIATVSAQSTSGPSFPAQLNAYLAKYVQLTPAQRNLMLSGAPVVKLLPSDPAREVSVFGAVWIKGAPRDYVKLVQDIEQFERGGPFRVTKRISDPPQAADFAALTLPREDLESLRTCRVGDCEIKLAESALLRVRRSVDWSTPNAAAAAETVAEQLMLEFVKGYIEAGNDGLAVYRDAERPTFVASEFRSMIDRTPALGEHLPDLKAYLMGFPKVTIPGATSFLYWQEAQFGLKPTIRISHLVIDDRPGVTVIASKLLYASHYFWTALDVRVLVEDPARGPGFWFVNVTRSRSDGLDGFVGRIIRGKVQNEALKGIESALNATKRRVEKP
jgi:hypothetical protein